MARWVWYLPAQFGRTEPYSKADVVKLVDTLS
jgi:hypothetical protein